MIRDNLLKDKDIEVRRGVLKFEPRVEIIVNYHGTDIRYDEALAVARKAIEAKLTS